MGLVAALAAPLGLERLEDHLPALVGSLAACALLQLASRSVFSPVLFPAHYPPLSAAAKFGWDTRFVAWLHALYATPLALSVLARPHAFAPIHADWLFGYHARAMDYLAISAGYFLWDSIVSLVLAINGHGLGFLVHALSCFVAFLYSLKPFCGYFGFAFLLWESSTIFLNPHWFFDKLHMTGSKAQVYNGFALLITFFLSRLVLGNWTSYQLFVSAFQPGVRERAGPRLLTTILCLDVVLSGLNIYWFSQMIASVRKRMKQPTVAKLKSG